MSATASLVHQTTTGMGSGNLPLAIVNGRRSFVSAFSSGITLDVFYYFIMQRPESANNEWEFGTGHINTAGELVRDTVIASSNSNALVNFGAGTKDVVNDQPAGVFPPPKTISATNYTLLSTDNGRILRFTSGSPISLSCPNSFPAGFNVGILQMGAGQVTCAAASGATVNNRQSLTKTAGIYAAASLVVQDNSGGSAAKYILGGDCA